MAAVIISLVSTGQLAARTVTTIEKGCSAHAYQVIQDFGVKQVGLNATLEQKPVQPRQDPLHGDPPT